MVNLKEMGVTQLHNIALIVIALNTCLKLRYLFLQLLSRVVGTIQLRQIAVYAFDWQKTCACSLCFYFWFYASTTNGIALAVSDPINRCVNKNDDCKKELISVDHLSWQLDVALCGNSFTWPRSYVLMWLLQQWEYEYCLVMHESKLCTSFFLHFSTCYCCNRKLELK